MRKFLSLLLTLLLILCLSLSVFADGDSQRENAGEEPEALDPRVEAMLAWAIATAEDDSHGYSQRVRFGPSYDCTSFVCTALMEGGFALESYVCTGGLLTELPKLGFTVYRSRETEAVRGDILIRLGKHAEICMGDGGCVAAHQDYDGRSGDSTGREIQYRKAGELYGCPFCRYRQYDYIIRYEGPAPLELPLHVPEPCVDAIS